MELEFTTTACNRPEILYQTYKSYTTKLKGIDFKKSTLYINIDPAPNNDNIMNVIHVAKYFFGNVVYNIPETPNFAEAVLWCFNQVKGEFFFHLEDDWILREEININDMIKILNKGNYLQCILNKKSNIEPFEPAFIPSLFRTKVMKFYLSLMNNESNPEAQIKNIYRNNLYNIRKYVSINFKTNIELSHDIGREWLKKKGLKRDYDKHKDSSIKSKNWTPWTTWTYS